MSLSGNSSVSEDPEFENSELISPANNFEFWKPELWPLWKKRFLRSLKTEAEIINILCYITGEQSEAILIKEIPNTDGKTFVDVPQTHTDHVYRKKNVILERHRFNSLTRRPEESVDQSITALQTLEESCQYGITKNESIRDRIFRDLLDSKISEKLQLKSYLTLEDAMTIAGQAEVQRSQDEVFQNSYSQAEISYESGGNVREEKSAKEDAQSMRDFVEKAKSNAASVDHSPLSNKNDCQLRTTKHPWRPSQLKSDDASEEDIATEALYKKVRGILNKLMPENLDRLVNQFWTLEIDSQDKLQGVVDLVYDKAVGEPSFSAVYTLMCKKLGTMRVGGLYRNAGEENNNLNFRKLIISRCQMKFEKNTVDENARAIKMKEVEACGDPEKKKELQQVLTEEERRICIKSVGNIIFIGELFKQGMLTTNIMHRCIRHLLTQIDEKSLECLCKLLSTIGKDLETKQQNLDTYFKQMLDIVNRKVPGKVSSKVRLMLQDVIELRLNKWIPRRDDSNPKTMDQIQKEAETERLDTHMNNTPMNTPRKDDRNSDRKRNPKTKNQTKPKDGRNSRNGSQQLSSRSSSRDSSLHDSSRSQSMSMSPPQPIKSIPPPAPASTPSKPASTMTEEQLAKKAANILEEYLSDTNTGIHL